MTLKPPISYYGGKQRLASKIIPLIPQHTVYVEPFCGGATIMFKKPWPEVINTDHYREVINDVEGRLINFYKQLRDNGERLIEMIQLTLYSEKEHQESLRENLNCDDELDVARRYFVNISQSFSNILSSGWGMSTFTRNHAATWARKVNCLPEYLDRMSAVYISCADAIQVIKKWDSPQSFFYVDPPYIGTDQGHYSGYTEQDFADLCKVLNDCLGSFLLSSYANDLTLKHVNPTWERFDFRARSTSAKQIKGKTNHDTRRTETVWRRFNRVPVREEIQKLYDSGKFDCFVENPVTALMRVWS